MKLVVNGVEMEVEAGKNALDLAGEISKELKKEALAARLNGEVISLVTPINEEGTLEIVGFEDEDGRRTLPPHRQPCAGSGGQAPQARGQAGHRPGHRKRLLL